MTEQATVLVVDGYTQGADNIDVFTIWINK